MMVACTWRKLFIDFFHTPKWIILLNVMISQIFSEVNGDHRIQTLPTTAQRDPWLTPRVGILVSEKTPVYLARRTDDRIFYDEIPNAIEFAINYTTNVEGYRRATVENIINPNHQPVQAQNSPTDPPAPGDWPRILYPEIIVVVAHDLYEKLGSTPWKAIPYLLTYWNGVDMLYRGIENPKIRLNIAGIIIETEYGVFDYLTSRPTDIKLLKGSILDDAAAFWYSQKDQISLDSYDLLVTMTSRINCDENIAHFEECAFHGYGRAKVSGMCKYSHDEKTVSKVAIVTDKGNFDRIGTAAHEIGHTLGMQHDNSLVPSDLVGLEDIPGCNKSAEKPQGFMMASTILYTMYERRWSNCSLDYLQRFLREKNHTCLHNTPAIGTLHIPRFLPGRVAGTRDEQCRARGYGKSCHAPENICKQFHCELDEFHNNCMYLTSAPLEGTPCDFNDPKRFCMFGRCVSEIEFL